MADVFAIVLDYCMRLVVDLQGLALNLLNWFTDEVEFLGNNISIYELFLGSSLTLVLTYGIVKFIVDIIP